MLEIPELPPDKAAAEIVRKFINNRLIVLMEEIIDEEVAFDMIMSGVADAVDMKDKSIDEIIDIDELMQDMDFAENVSLMYLPDGYPIEKANREFLGLYKLLKAKNEYIPELPMDYVLYRVIMNEIWQVDQINEDMEDGLFDDLTDDPFFEGIEDEEVTTVERTPEPERSIVLKALEAWEDENVTAEDLINLYEDLRKYEEVCFWDTDFLFLDQMSEEELIHSDMAKALGIGERRDTQVMEISTDGSNKIRFEVNIPPWENEE